ncbi:NTP transferase domain-containing protein [Colwellia sp. RSH04]|uniref:NTP transferase domain-containing protein n=1 Tax=Colwellia sp. RSH04 TaxID=2305464 RepID=UPI000E583824|nr:NTP transferase domain-containing protein [Colwellia sp. RSH04]RHW76587.1 hypothetical protein D1094_05725 [Colwellia sp. RSH04]
MKTLVILAAGLGSRFGGDKQLTEFGPQSKTLMEYNIIHAVEAGFERCLFVIRPALQSFFDKQIVPRLPKSLTVDFVHQTTHDLPLNCSIAETRQKPLGTAHALWCCRKKLTGNFAVINADDYYGADCFNQLILHYQHTTNNYLMVAYQLEQTLSQFGGVNRGICKLSDHNTLLSIEEGKNIIEHNHKITAIFSDHTRELTDNNLVSMNCWLFTSDIFSAIEQVLCSLLSNDAVDKLNQSAECYLPDVVMSQINTVQKQVKVVTTSAKWFGLTFREDTDLVEEKITALFSKKM